MTTQGNPISGTASGPMPRMSATMLWISRTLSSHIGMIAWSTSPNGPLRQHGSMAAKTPSASTPVAAIAISRAMRVQAELYVATSARPSEPVSTAAAELIASSSHIGLKRNALGVRPR